MNAQNIAVKFDASVLMVINDLHNPLFNNLGRHHLPNQHRKPFIRQFRNRTPPRFIPFLLSLEA
ncbi:hypothetical protein AS156_35430 [Bradyrhizobium macuxiense]|uniref:Uncharacterized protein n=1 Tax=Bradyrhizobium macuxiense TaxID=1755647 RepID=A0A120FQ79_9BRAD|nr:hypothetical protein AS156_35430 [Bradyrhizobium macuxiense]